MMAGQVAEAGYNAAKATLGGPSAADRLSATGADERQKKLQLVLNSVDIGQDVNSVIEKMGEPAKEKSGNAYGFTCYEYPAVYSATDAAVIMAKNGKVAFYGNSRCNAEMADVNFKKDGKYSGGTISSVNAAPPVNPTPMNPAPASSAPTSPAPAANATPADSVNP